MRSCGREHLADDRTCGLRAVCAAGLRSGLWRKHGAQRTCVLEQKRHGARGRPASALHELGRGPVRVGVRGVAERPDERDARLVGDVLEVDDAGHHLLHRVARRLPLEAPRRHARRRVALAHEALRKVREGDATHTESATAMTHRFFRQPAVGVIALPRASSPYTGAACARLESTARCISEKAASAI